MSGKPPIPWPGMAMALLAALALAATVGGPGLAIALFFAWIASLWIEWRRRPVAATPLATIPRVDIDAVMRGAMCAAIEPLDAPLLLAHAHRILAANAAARTALGAHIVGQDARVALRHPDAVTLLDLADGGSATIRGLTGARSLWQLTRRRIDATHWIIELRDRSPEADLSRAHTDFVANASHELRTPLSSIIGYVETLADAPGALDPETTARFLATVLREARRMQNLVADLMSLSQLEAEKHDIPTESVDLGALAARVVNEFTHGESEGRVRFTPSPEPMRVTGDMSQIEQLLRNLVDNALKYGDTDQPVDVGLSIEGTQLALVTITDHGPGIASDHLPHLTRRFYRADAGRSRAAGGTGLGLAIVKHIVERHRGKLDITSAIGVGTQVSVRLPLVPAPAALTPA